MIVPYISREDVSAALSSLIHMTRKPVADGLQHLLLVDLLISTPSRPDSDEKRAFAVLELLTGEITHALHDQCDVFRLVPPRERTTMDKIQKEVGELVKAGKHDLMAWSALYYRYVRADLDLSVEALAQLFAVNARTVARYHEDGIDMLVQRLIHREQAARHAQIVRRMYAMLPYSVPITLVGRNDLLNTTENLLRDLSPCHLLITGSMGVGKTVFVQELLRREIAADRVDHLVWLDRPASILYVRQQITEQLLREGGEIKLRDYLLIYRVVIVLDKLDLIAADNAALGGLLRDLGAAVVILVNRAFIPLDGVVTHLVIPEIDSISANILINRGLRLRGNVNSEHIHELALDLHQQLGGNPLTLRLATGMWEYGTNWDTLTHDIQGRLLGQIFDEFSEQVKITWCALALVPHPVGFDLLGRLWVISVDTVSLLRSYGLIEGDEHSGYSLVTAAGDYIRQIYPTNQTIQKYFAALLDKLTDDVGQSIWEHILVTGFPEVPLVQRANIIYRARKAGRMHGHWADWRKIIEDMISQTEEIEPEIRIAFGVCLRSLAEWEAAQQVFYKVSLECGRDGRFSEQARALIEWSVLAKYQGEYQRAQALIVQTKRFAIRAQDNDLLNEALCQEAWILVEQGSGAKAYELLAALPESLHGLVGQSEAQLTLGNYDVCRILAARARQLTDDSATEASLYTIIGRSYQGEKDYQQAHAYLTEALTLFQRLEDTFRIGRAQTNLAAVFIAMKRYVDADLLLADAAKLQSLIGDKVGLSATRHNLNVLGGYIAR